MFEIQLRSVLMDAWAGISHDLQYKALFGDLTVTELKLLDALKGHVEVGEIMLDQLHRVHRNRIETENDTITSSRQLWEILSDSIPGSQLANAEIGDLDTLFLFVQAIDADTPRGFRALLPRLDIKTRLREDMEHWRQRFDPVPTTVVWYLVERLLPHLSVQFEEFRAIGERMRPHYWRDGGYWQSLIWISRELTRSLELPGLDFKGSYIRKYVHLWCAEFYRRMAPALMGSHGFAAGCLARTRKCSTPGPQFFAELYILGVAPKALDYEEVHTEPDYVEIAVFMIKTYEIDSQAWLDGVYDFKRTLHFSWNFEEDRFLRSVDIALWLTSLRAQHLLGQLLRHWPFHERPLFVSDEVRKFDTDLSNYTASRQCQQLIRPLEEEPKGYYMLDIKPIVRNSTRRRFSH
ncbi:hypothetical protein NPX13_g8280 [Xylaria arbuscula]|uniref:RelA/SpoT domain-containing protein n=1 Tax=Xylaria arbuscula TaxID=114810 RepID=A0A9W8N995_9PEZI|nr:hypothetical protein NPX13_g8280 [Xylaria arbuscula]